jgi:hypothetical protein
VKNEVSGVKLRVSIVVACAVTLHLSLLTLHSQAKPVTYKGLEVTPLGIERARNVALIDCPPGSNTVRGNAREGEEFAVVNLGFKVTPAFAKDTIVKKPILTDTAGKTYNTSVSIIDAGSVGEYKCSFPFRVPAGTKVASVTIDTAAINLASLDK